MIQEGKVSADVVLGLFTDAVTKARRRTLLVVPLRWRPHFKVRSAE